MFLGWLHAAPKLRADKDNRTTRQGLMSQSGKEIEYPPCEFNYMVEHLFSCGPVLSNAMGSSPLCHQEIRAWLKNMRLKLCPWEINALREMSRQYLYQLVQSENEDTPPPWVPEIDEVAGKQIVSKVKDILRG